MSRIDEIRQSLLAQAQGTMSLNLAFIGVANGLFEALAAEPISSDELAKRNALDCGYVRRWCEAAFAFGLLDLENQLYRLTDIGSAFRPSTVGSAMPFAVQAVLGAHMSERTAELMRTGERPGESVLAERATILPWFGPMLEASFGAVFEREILPRLDVFREVGGRGGVVVDLGCGNGWYLRKLAAHFPQLSGIGLDGFGENVRQATEAARAEGLAARLSFREGDIHHFDLGEPVALIAMNRALHHVWEQRADVFDRLRNALAPGGAAVVWEPRWPDEVAALRDPRRRGMAFQNLSEHVQGNHFLRPEEIESAMRSAGLEPQTHLFADGNEAVIVGTRVA